MSCESFYSFRQRITNWDRTDTYFTKFHPTIPIINQYRFQAAMHLSSNARPPVSLRYAMWALAASINDKYKPMHSHFYTRARKYAEIDETSGREKYVNIRHCQAWLLIATYAFKMALFPHAFLTTSRATRLAQMLGLYQMDGSRLTAKQTLVSPGDICEREERRRTFWMAYCMDRYSGVGTGWPWIIDERDVNSHTTYYRDFTDSVRLLPFSQPLKKSLSLT